MNDLSFLRKTHFDWSNIANSTHEVNGHITAKMRKFGNRGLGLLSEVLFTLFIFCCLFTIQKCAQGTKFNNSF